jgi:hypothetical protein
MHALKLKMNTRTKHIRTRTQYIKKGKYTKSSLISEATSGAWANARLDSWLPTGFHLRYYSKPEPLQVKNYKVVSVALISTGRGIFIGVQGWVTDLVKSITRQVVAGQPSHVAGWPWSLASIDLQLRIPLYHLLESVTVKPTRERMQGGAGRPAMPWAHWSVTFAHCLLVSVTPPVWHLFWWNSKFPCNFLKCFNLAPMLLKSNKH